MREGLDGINRILILRKPRSGCLEERTVLFQPIVDFFTADFAGMTVEREG
jgi:hypothetical protein